MPNFKDPISILRILEFICAVVTFGIHRGLECNNYSLEKAQFLDGLTIAYVIISTYAVVALLLEEVPGRRAFAFIAFVGALVYVAVGAIMIQVGADHDCRQGPMIASGVFALATAICYFVDVVFIARSL